MAIQIRRRIGQDGPPTTAHLPESGQLGYHRGQSAPVSDDLYINAAGTIRTLISPTRQVETHGNQPIDGDKTFNGHSTFTGDVTIQKSPVAQTDGANKGYVDDQVARGGGGFQERWNPSTNVPDITIATKHNGYYWIASESGQTPLTPVIPGIAPHTQFNTGDWIIWEEHNTAFARIPAGGMTEEEANVLYLRLTGGTLAPATGVQVPLILHTTGAANAVASHIRFENPGGAVPGQAGVWEVGPGPGGGFQIIDQNSPLPPPLARLTIDQETGTVNIVRNFHVTGNTILDGTLTGKIDDGTY